jgi:cytoskeletal protein CcmA (bactofilin family)
MGIISRGHTPDRKRTGTTVIAAGTQLVGDLSLSDSLHVDGSVEGKIESNGEVSIGTEGRIDGELRADTVMVSGRFEGSIEAKRLEIVSTGKVSGSISVDQLVIESGAQFNGTSEVAAKEREGKNQASSQGKDRDAASGSASTDLEGAAKQAS